MPHGVPLLCSDPNVVSTASGDWSNPQTWSTRRVPNKNDRITISRNHTVIYDVIANTELDCIEVQGHLTFSPDVDTQMRVGTIMVLEESHLEIGTFAKPISSNRTSPSCLGEPTLKGWPARS